MKEPRKKARRWRLLVLAVYAALLAASHASMKNQAARARPAPDQQLAEVREVRGDQLLPRRVGLAYRSLGDAGAPAIVLLSSGDAAPGELAGLAAGLMNGHRVLIPELPGLGNSTRDIGDLSFVAQAAYLRQFFDSLGADRAHLVAFGLAGGVALEFQRNNPGRVASLTFVSAVGVQELELMGDYSLNHALQGCELAAVWCARNLVPHFGLLDRATLNYSRVRCSFDSDQRPLRGLLENYCGPMLIVHGKSDVLVPVAAACEHARIVPQSERVLLDGGHHLAQENPAGLAERIAGFVGRVGRGEAALRATAAADRIQAAGQPFDSRCVEQTRGMAALVIILLIALSTLISEDLACVGAGLMAAKGIISYGDAALAAFIGIFVGDLLLYALGRYVARPAMKRVPFKWIFREQAIKQSSEWFNERGPMVILLSRFLPGSRFPTYVAAGLLHTNFWQFMLFFFVAGAIWAPLLVWTSMALGGRLLLFFEQYKFYTAGAVIATVFLLWLLFKVIVPAFTHRGRRLLVSRWRRLTHWEFWPRKAVYPPIALYALCLGIRHRGLGVFAACNPSIPFGDLVGASKSNILDQIKDRRFIARYRKLPLGPGVDEHMAAIADFLRENGLTYPFVMKPDWGQQGLGVAVIRNEQRLRAYLEQASTDLIVQEYVAGEEFGLFYYRYPDEPRGRIFSVTEKRFPTVVGDGKKTLERLILDDSRAVCCARMFLERFRHRLHTVPAEGEPVALNEIGNHARGSLFLNGRWVLTRELEDAFEEIARSFDGFHFGRFDVRAPCIEEFKKGRGFRIIELNGVTAESTDMYDPSNSLFTAWGMLMTQWRIAYEIGAINRKRGAKVPSIRELLACLRDHEPAKEVEQG